MKMISKNAAIALINDGRYKSKNTETKNGAIRLHWTNIALKVDEHTYKVTLGGFNTVTTKERVNSLLECLGCSRKFHQRKGSLYFGDTPITESDVITLKHGQTPLIETHEVA